MGEKMRAFAHQLETHGTLNHFVSEALIKGHVLSPSVLRHFEDPDANPEVRRLLLELKNGLRTRITTVTDVVEQRRLTLIQTHLTASLSRAGIDLG